MNGSENRQIIGYRDITESATGAGGSGKRKNAILWQILFYLALLLLCFSIAGTIVTAMLGLYSHTADDTIAYQIQRITKQKATQILDEYNRHLNGWDFYDLSGDYRGITNFRYSVYLLYPNGEEVYVTGSYNDEAYEATAEAVGEYYVDEPYVLPASLKSSFYGTDYAETMMYPADATETAAGSTPDTAETNSPTLEESAVTLYVTEERQIRGYYCPQPGVIDLYTVMEQATWLCASLQYVFPLGILVCAVLCVILGVILTRQLWQLSESADGGVMLLSRIPFDLICVITTILIPFSDFVVGMVTDSFRESLPDLWAVGLLALLVLALPFFFTVVYSALVVQMEKRQLLSSTVLAWLLCRVVLPVLRFVGGGLARFAGMIPFAWRTAIGVPVVGLIILFFAIGAYAQGGVYLILLAVGCLAVYVLCLYAAYAIRVLQKSGEELSRGNLSYKTDTRKLRSVFREQAENLNAIGDGMEAAVAEKMKSEHFKTELITNVSHDIKTPLTSIINYADLLSKEELSGKAREYTEILLRQSARLKKLTEDLVEASKATTGNLSCNPERLSVCQIVRQSLGEYEERLEAAGLQVRTTIPEGDLYAMVDGRLLWRVLENLYSNATKYALSGTRVYLVVTEDDGRVCISMKNISREPLTVDGEELTERFVKGDASRSSEGSGLGLNIARSLVELQHGTFRVTCDGDLFRCDISFAIVE